MYIIGVIYIWTAIAYSVYCYYRRTDKGSNDIARRYKALGLGLLWPVDVVRLIQGRKPGGLNRSDQQALEESKRKILG
jgi:hypothetical protein